MIARENLSIREYPKGGKLSYLITLSCLTVKYSKLDELSQQVQYLQSVVSASNIQSQLPSVSPQVSTRPPQQSQSSSPGVIHSERLSFSEGTNPSITTSFYGCTASANPSASSYQTETLPESPYRGSVSFITGATGKSLPNSSPNQPFQRENAISSSDKPGPLTPVSQFQIDGIGPKTVSHDNTFRQDYFPTQPRSIGPVFLNSEQVNSLFKS